MKEEQLVQFKLVYKSITLDENHVNDSWNDLAYRLKPRQNRIFTYTTAFALVTLILIFAIVGYSLNSKPGSSFYALKTISKTFSEKVMSVFESHNIQPTGIIKKSIILSSPTFTPTPSVIQAKLTSSPKDKNLQTNESFQNNNSVTNTTKVKGVSNQNNGAGQSNSENSGNNGNENKNNSDNGKKIGASKH